MDAISQKEINTGDASILLVDDDENILSSLQRLLRSEGYHIRVASSGAQGLELLIKKEVDLVISDMRMPAMDGAEFLRQVALEWPDSVRILITGHADLHSTISAINAGGIYKYISKPWEDNQLRLEIKHALEKRFLEKERCRLQDLTAKQNQQLKEFNATLEATVKDRTSELFDAMTKYVEANEALKKNYAASVKVFANLIGLRQESISGHSRRVATQAMHLAKKLGLGKEQTQQILFAGLLHDLGKISLPDRLIGKSFDSLSRQERELTMKHAVIGESLLMPLEPLKDAAKIIGSHHEHFNGKGFPGGLKGDAIPMGSRILAIVNDYDALQLGTLAKTRMSSTQAVEFIKQNIGTRYDPDVAMVFMLQLKEQGNDVFDQDAMHVSSASLQIGMVLAEGLTTQDGFLLLSKGQVLDASLIQMISHYEKHTGEKLDFMVKPTGETKCIESN